MNPPPGILALSNGQWTVEGDTHLGAWAFEHGSIVTDPWLFKFLKPHLDGVEVVYDIGGNIGDHCRQYLDWGKQVVAWEPHPVAFACLAHNCPEAMLFNAAASDAAGSLNFAESDNVGASRIAADGEWSVPALRIDDIPGLPPPGFVKVDVEGHELFALRGMEQTLRDHRPILFVEFNRGALAANGHTPVSLLGFILGLGYHEDKMVIYPDTEGLDAGQFDILFLP